MPILATMAAERAAAIVVAGGLTACAFAALHQAEIDLARAQYPHCELRATLADGRPAVLAMGNPGEDCKSLAARSKPQLPADYRAIWFELVPGD